jgi:hypothetical protein
VRSRDEYAFSTNAWNDVCKQYGKLIPAVVSQQNSLADDFIESSTRMLGKKSRAHPFGA